MQTLKFGFVLSRIHYYYRQFNALQRWTTEFWLSNSTVDEMTVIHTLKVIIAIKTYTKHYTDHDIKTLISY